MLSINSKLSIILVSALTLSMFGLVKTKVYVQGLCSDIQAMETKKDDLTEEIKVLMAEWSYLNKMERLEDLSEKYLGLKKVNLTNLKTVSKDLKPSIFPETQVQQVRLQKHMVKNNVNWRYKPRASLLQASAISKGKKQ